MPPRTNHASTDRDAAGAALASLELHRTLIALLVERGVVPADAALRAVDTALARVEKMEGGAASLGMEDMMETARVARSHLEVVLQMLADVPAGR